MVPFKFILLLVFILEWVLILKCLWRGKEKILEIVTLTENMPQCLKLNLLPSKRNKQVALLVCIFYAGSSLFSGVWRILDYHWKTKLTANIGLILKSAAIFQVYILAWFGSIFLLSNVLTLWTVAKTFSGILKMPQTTWPDIQDSLNCLRNLANEMNELLGHPLTLYVIASVLYFAIEAEAASARDGEYSKVPPVVELLISFLFTSLFMLLMADVNYQVGGLKTWLINGSIGKSMEPIPNITLVLDLINNSGVALKASNIFPITYGFTATVRISRNL